MKNLISELFKHHNFKLVELDFGDLYISKDRVYYWLVVEQNDIAKVLAMQDEWFEKCKEKIKTKDFDKNTSLLILLNRDEHETKKKDILFIEEDPYQFKKYVLVYDSESHQNLISNSGVGKPKEILDLLVRESVFNEYKSNYSEYNWRHLLYNIAQKLPFLDVNIAINQDLENLFDDAKQSLTQKNLIEYSQFVAKLYAEKQLERIEDFNLDELINLFDNTTKNGD